METNSVISGDIASKEKFIRSNIGLVFQTAYKFNRSRLKFSLTLDDLVQEGNIALMEVAEKYDSEFSSFSTYAVPYIWGKMVRVINTQSNMIRVPERNSLDFRKFKGERYKFYSQFGRFPNDEEIFERIDIGINRENMRKTIIVLDKGIPSLNVPVPGIDSGEPYISFIKDEEIDIEQEVEDRTLGYDLDRIMKRVLSYRNYQVMKMRYGLDDGEPMRLEEVGLNFGITRERVRQLQERSLKKLRRDPEAYRVLRGYLE